jgi:serine/threonine-protein kinase
MGTVWLARLSGKLNFEKLVAVKTILPTLCEDRKFVDMFIDEARIAAGIDHENVARILEIGEDHGSIYYAMELIDGESLRKLHRDMRAARVEFPMGVALRVVADACAGLHAAHELKAPDGTPRDVVHRDVSPQNFLVTVRGTVKLIDFGVAKARERLSEDTATGTLKGKVEYMAPEQARGEPLDRRADVYSVGAILYELLTGLPLRDTSDGRQMAALHQLMTNQPYAALPTSIPHVVRGVVQRALASEPDRRYESADAMRLALEHAMLATGLTATTDDVAKLLETFCQERMTRRRNAIAQALDNAGWRNAAAPTPRISRSQLVPPAPSSTRTVTPHSVTPPPYPYHQQQQYTERIHQPPPSGPVDGAPTGPSIRTVGGASFSALPPATGGGTAKTVAIALAICLVAILGVVAGVVATRRHDEPWGGLTPVPQPPIAAGTVLGPTETAPALPVVADAAAPVVVARPPAPPPPKPQAPPPPVVAAPPPKAHPHTSKGPTKIGSVVEAPDDDGE